MAHSRRLRAGGVVWIRDLADARGFTCSHDTHLFLGDDSLGKVSSAQEELRHMGSGPTSRFWKRYGLISIGVSTRVSSQTSNISSLLKAMQPLVQSLRR